MTLAPTPSSMCYCMTYWNENGTAPEKLIVEFPAYGQTFTPSDPSNTGISVPTANAGTLGPYTEEPVTWAYYEICTFLNDGATEAWGPGSTLCLSG
ncbi:rCG28502 [Rattus norvegicus]|uniref:RCG28502 n=1 Tax=Rattus norvegicus TaxID=10116 RepID=A6HUP6_RAT|nr:rCG28502 [Rattus norvegicus]